MTQQRHCLVAQLHCAALWNTSDYRWDIHARCSLPRIIFTSTDSWRIALLIRNSTSQSLKGCWIMPNAQIQAQIHMVYSPSSELFSTLFRHSHTRCCRHSNSPGLKSSFPIVQPRCDEPWQEMVFADPAEGKLTVRCPCLTECGNKCLLHH